MLREHMHRVVDKAFDVPRALLGDRHAALAWRHVRRAHGEMLLALRAVADGALSYFGEKPGGEPLVRVEVQGEDEAAGSAEGSISMNEKGKDLTPPYGYLAPLVRPFPDIDWSFIRPVRQKAVELLNLQEGDRVLDVGCGLGGSFPYLVRAVGQSGQVVGVEISPVISVNARRRIEKNGWSNVELIEADARTVQLTGTFDGLLMFASDVMLLEEALENIFPHLRKNARVVAFGAKPTSNRLGKVWNPLSRMLFKLNFSTTPKPGHDPWRLLAKRVEQLDIEEYFLGTMWLASGSVAKASGQTNAGSA